MSVPRHLARVIGRGRVSIVVRGFSSSPIRTASAPSDPAPVPHVTNAWRNYGIAGARMLCVLGAFVAGSALQWSPTRFQQGPTFSTLPSCYVSVLTSASC